MHVDTPPSGQQAAKLQWRITDHRHAWFTGFDPTERLDSLMIGNFGSPAPRARGPRQMCVEGSNSGMREVRTEKLWYQLARRSLIGKKNKWGVTLKPVHGGF